jgi:hypothetical protein
MTRMGIPHVGRRAMAPLLAVAIVSLAALGFTAPALAKKPTGEWAQFGDCPLSNPSVALCVFAQTTSGEFKIGSTSVPLTKPTTLQGGLEIVEEGRKEVFVNAADGNTLSKTPQAVPGGLLKIMAPEFLPEPLKKIFDEFINKGPTGVNATTELVGEVQINVANIQEGSGIGLTLPVRVHLENEFLGPSCFIGSKAHPVNVELTTGTTSPPLPNEPITGSPGELSEKGGGTIIVLKKNSLVNNSFAAPVAEGCGSQILFGIFTGVIDSAVNSELGLPSAAGHNTAILTGTQELAVAEAVKASEK